MGVFVSVVQAVVFSLLATVYIGTAVAHEEH
jgi:F0F1-type ATP synthase membrane subunit a